LVLTLIKNYIDYFSHYIGAYEMERLTGAAFGNDEFQDAIKRNVRVW